MNSTCQITPVTQDIRFWLITIEIIIAIAVVFLLVWMIKLVDRIEKNKLARIFYFIISVIGSLALFIITSIAAIIILYLAGIIPYDYPPSYDYHILNAAIKNTCFLDPQKNHCPKTVQDLINIEPEHFKALTKNAHLTYQYYPQTNEYTLIVRNNDLKRNDYRVVIFDPRLTTLKNYGRGLDFLDAKVMECNGKFLLKNPPPFPGPWNKIN